MNSHFLDQVTWDEPDVFYNVKRVSPWQVELIPGSPHLAPSPYPLLKRPRAGQSQIQDLLPDGSEKKALFPFPELPHAATRSTEACALINSVSPAGMQGARHDQLYDFLPAGIYSVSPNVKPRAGNWAPKRNRMPPELNCACALQSENSSPPSKDGVYSRFADLVSGPAGGADPRASSGSFQLFGKTIRTENLATAEAPEAGGDRRVDAVAPYNFSLSKPAEAVPR